MNIKIQSFNLNISYFTELREKLIAKQRKEKLKLEKILEFVPKIEAFDFKYKTSHIYPEKKCCYKKIKKLKHEDIVIKPIEKVPNDDFFAHLENKKKQERDERKRILAEINAPLFPSMPLL
jgi:hypothetical protein